MLIKVHELKCWPSAFGPLTTGQKHVELRKDDRLYQVGDILLLREWDPDTEKETGRVRVAKVTHLIRHGDEFGNALQKGYVALSVRIYREPRSI